MSTYVLEVWAIILVILAAIIIMSFLIMLPSTVVVIWRMKRVTEISLDGTM